jgi:hypothetical protein
MEGEDESTYYIPLDGNVTVEEFRLHTTVTFYRTNDTKIVSKAEVRVGCEPIVGRASDPVVRLTGTLLWYDPKQGRGRIELNGDKGLAIAPSLIWFFNAKLLRRKEDPGFGRHAYQPQSRQRL